MNNAGGQFVAPAERISVNGFRAVTRLDLDAVSALNPAWFNKLRRDYPGLKSTTK